jgi:hypothetical protein
MYDLLCWHKTQAGGARWVLLGCQQPRSVSRGDAMPDLCKITLYLTYPHKIRAFRITQPNRHPVSADLEGAAARCALVPRRGGEGDSKQARIAPPRLLQAW